MKRCIEMWLILQLILYVAILCMTPFTQIHLPYRIKLVGVCMMFTGLFIGLIANFYLGENFTPFVTPKKNGKLITSGIYGIVRHPIYTAAIILAFGWTIYCGSILGFVLSIILIFVLDGKAKEEKLLIKKFPEYAEYKSHVKKMIPFIY